MEEKIQEWLQNQFKFGNKISPFEFALQCIFTDWNGMKIYKGKEDDQHAILDSCNSLNDVAQYLKEHYQNMNFLKSPVWKSVYNR